MKPLPPGSGITGRLALRGRIPLGYYKDPAKSGHLCRDRWRALGDAGRHGHHQCRRHHHRFWAGLCVHQLRRREDFPEEVEAALKSHPDVFDAVVVGVSDERWGERVAAVVALRNGSMPTLEELRQPCEPRLARHKIPRLLVTVPVVRRSPAAIPTTVGRGKPPSMPAAHHQPPPSQ